jgi:hypothetical protein
MTKDEALKMAIEALENNKRTHYYCEDTWYSCPKHEDGCANEYAGKECDCGADETNKEFDNAILACKEALEQPSVAELNDEYLRDTHVEGLSQPAQEPVAWINVKDKLPPQEINFLSFSETFGYQISMYSSNPLNSTGLPTLERLKITKWMPIPHITLSAPSWQGLSDDEKLVRKWKDAYKIHD